LHHILARRLSLTASLAVGITMALAAAPAYAQERESAGDRVATGDQSRVFTDGDYAIVGIGIGYMPSYEGSDNYIITGAPLIVGSYHGFDFESRGTALSVDLLPNSNDSALNLKFGPEVRLNLDRTSRINDTTVRALGERDVAVEAGGFVGLSYAGLLNPYDSVTARVGVLTDITSQHDGTLVTPSLTYSSPLSQAVLAFVSIDGTWIDDNYASSFFGVTPAGTLASGLPTFAPGSGWKDVSVNLGANYDLSGDLRDGGLGVFAGASYNRLLEDAARSPIVRLRGDRDQWFLAAGVTYGF
jgi:MipA family protein